MTRRNLSSLADYVPLEECEKTERTRERERGKEKGEKKGGREERVERSAGYIARECENRFYDSHGALSPRAACK